ncbi:ABC transporter permease subunit [Bosea sp. RAF48]|uniref:ABC transporter permease n=1 Tax=Bosea sp. RAF48 TaxID=3237480 RepID=UPI003F91ECFE
MSRRNLLAAALIAPLLLLVTLSFLVPLGATLYRAVEDSEFSTALPRTAALLKAWDGKELPPEEAFRSLIEELRLAQQDQAAGAVLSRLNFEETGLRSLLLQASRASARLAEPFKDSLVALNPRWGDPALWRLFKRATGPWTSLYLLRSLDLRPTDQGVIRAPSEDAVFLPLFWRTFEISLVVTLICALLAYPVAYTLSILPQGWANAGMMLVLIPFWTSILVRTTAWFIILQREGPINALLMAFDIVNQPLAMIFTRFAVYLAMVHVLLPFAILPLYGVMKGIKPDYMRAAASLGAPGWRRFLRIYLPLTMPGVAAGSLMVFMLSVGFYITPALVGGSGDQMVSYFIAFFTNTSVNWGMAAALATLLMTMTGLFVVVARLVLPGFRSGGVRV